MELIDYSGSSLTVSWPEVNGAKRYILQYRKDNASDQVVFQTLSANLTSTQARKRNLEGDGGGFFFRVGAITGDENEPKAWTTHQNSFHLLTPDCEANRMRQPQVHSDGSQAVKVTWSAVDNADGYELQMRENVGGCPWSTIASSLAGTEVRKKNLTSPYGYTFRVRPASTDSPFSPPSDVITGAVISEGIRRTFSVLDDGVLLANPKTTLSLSEALAGKEFVLLYASAHWCPPCRKFTPMLIQWYQQMKHYAEVIFLSADHDENSFASYFASMPWKAVPYDDDGREQLMGYIKVTGIPRLVVLDGKTGRILVENAVGQPLDINKWRELAAAAK
jgi:thiol-disulfide isomerase/thioredoxin